METSHLTLCIISGCESLHLFHLLPEEASLMMMDTEMTYEYSRITLEVILLVIFFFKGKKYLVLPQVSGLSNLWFLITQAVLDMGSLSWSGSYVKSDIGWLFPQVLEHRYFQYISKEGQNDLKTIGIGLVNSTTSRCWPSGWSATCQSLSFCHSKLKFFDRYKR